MSIKNTFITYSVLKLIDKILYVCKLVFYMKRFYKKSAKKCLQKLMAFVLMFLFANNILSQSCQLSLSNINSVGCYGDSTGSVVAQGFGGGGSYHYILQRFDSSLASWQQFAQSPGLGFYTAIQVSFTQIYAGSFRVIMTDSSACSDTVNFVISQPAAIEANFVIINESTPFTNDGGIALNLTGVLPGYTCSWIGSNGFNSFSQNINNLSAGTYNLYITNSNGCTYNNSVNVGLIKSCGVTNTYFENLLCYGDSSGSVSINGIFGSSPFLFSINYLNSQFSQTYASVDTFYVFDNLPDESYQIIINDALGCIDSLNVLNIIQPDSVIVTSFTTVTSTLTTCDGLINTSVTGGNSPYSYSWFASTSPNVVISNSDSLSNLCIGDYCVVVSDSNFCDTQPLCYNVGSYPPCTDSIQLTVSLNDATCRLGDGSLQLTPSAGHSPYFYSINGGSFDTIFNSTILIDTLFAGVTYNLVVKDSFCLTPPLPVILGVTPSPIIDSIGIINESCSGNDGQIIVYTQDSSLIDKYSLDTLFSWQPSSVFTGLSRGEYLVYIEDLNSCRDSVVAYIDSTTNPNISMATEVTDIVCNGDTNGTFKVLYPDTSYNYILYRYTLFNPQSAIDTGTYFNGLIKGWYVVEAISQSGICKDSSIVKYIDEPEPILYQSTSSNVNCVNNGVCDGVISLSVFPSGGISPYNYYLNELYGNIPLGPKVVSDPFSSICDGEYIVQVVDANACVVNDTVTVSDLSLVIDSVVINDVSCFGINDGKIKIYANGGNGIYSYLFSNGDTTQTIDSLAPGQYNVTVLDQSLCSVFYDSIIISQPDTLLFKITQLGKLEETCMRTSYDGQILLEITGGTAPYSYYWIGNSGVSGFGFGDTITNLTYDTITINVSDNNGCIGSPSWGTINISIVDALNSANPLVLDSVLIGNSPMCFGYADGSIQININQGESPYAYSINNGLTQNTSNIFSNLIASNYDIVIYDAFGCTDSSKILLQEFNEILINVDSLHDVSCFDGNDGYISVSTNGGIGGLNYFWIPTLNTTSQLSSLSAIPHVVQVTDSAGCLASDTIVLEHLTDPIQAIDIIINNASCYGESDGSVSIEIIGGMPFNNGDYNVIWINDLNDTIAIGNYADNLDSGVYLAIITDSFMCGPFIDTIFISQPDQFYLEVINKKHNSCFGDEEGEITVATFGGTIPYIDYFYSSNNGSLFSVNTSTYTDMTAGSYSLWSVDNKGCNSDTLFDVKLTEPDKIYTDPNNFNIIDLSCFQSDDGILETSLFGGVSPFKYQLSDNNIIFSEGTTTSGVLFSIYDLYAANFNLYITDYNLCSIDIQVLVSQPEIINADFLVIDEYGTEQAATFFENLSTNSDKFTWNFSNNILENNNVEDQVSHLFEKQGQHLVSLVASNSNLSQLCNDTASLIVDVEGYDIFNSFSPNNDGFNDVFYFDAWMMMGINVEIFNRWGQMVYHWSGIDLGWDGKGYNGEKLPEGVYFYIMNAQGSDDNTFEEKGSVTLFR